jgi:hypothetical protein
MNKQDTTHIYQIKVQGKLDPKWSDWFGDLDLTVQGNGQPITVITGHIADQSALRGILTKLWDLNLSLISVNQLT